MRHAYINKQLLCINDVISSHKGYDDISGMVCHAGQHKQQQQQQVEQQRNAVDSWVELLLPFSTSDSLREAMLKFDRKTIRYGKLFELIDALAGDVGYRHVGLHCGPNESESSASDFYVVTASVDGMLAFADVSAHEDLKLQGYVTWVGSSSMEVQINIIQAPSVGSDRLIGSTQFIMVARERLTGQAYKVPGLDAVPEDLQLGHARSNARKGLARQSLNILPPNAGEIEEMHSLFLKSQFLKLQKRALVNNNSSVTDLRSRLQGLERGGTDLISSAPKPFKYMKHTTMSTTQIMHYQNRNVHGKVFGGFLLRIGFEIGFIAASCFFQTESLCRFHSVDDVQFVRPADVGSFMEFEATAIFSKGRFLVVAVEVNDIDISTSFKSKTNSFSFVFSCDDESRVKDVMPRDYSEFIRHLEGRRVLDRLHGAELQAGQDNMS